MPQRKSAGVLLDVRSALLDHAPATGRPSERWKRSESAVSKAVVVA